MIVIVIYIENKNIRMTHYGIGLGNNIASNNHNIYRYQSVNQLSFKMMPYFYHRLQHQQLVPIIIIILRMI